MPIRVVVGVMTELLREIVRTAVASQSDFELVADLEHGKELLDVLPELQPDVVVLADGDFTTSKSLAVLLAAAPQTRVVTVSADGRRATLSELRSVPVTHVSPKGLLSAIRAAPGIPVKTSAVMRQPPNRRLRGR